MVAESIPGRVVASPNSCSDADWNEFLARCPGGHHEQTSYWAEVKGHYGWSSHRVTLVRDNRLVGGFQILTRREGKFLRIGYICKGPVAESWDEETIEASVQAIDRFARRNRISYLVADLPYDGEPLVPSLRRAGFITHPSHLPPTGLMKATTVVDVRPPLPEILARMTQSTRYNIRRGEREGVTVREGKANEIATFRRLMLDLCARLNSAPTPPEEDFFENLYGVFGPVGRLRLYLAEYKKQIVSAGIVFYLGNAARLWKVGWNGEAAKACPNNALWWGAMKDAKERGYEYFDLVGIDEKIARRTLAGEDVPAEEAGSAHFKLGYGGEVLLLPGQYTKFYNPFLRLLASDAGAALVNSNGLRRGVRFAKNLLSGSPKN